MQFPHRSWLELNRCPYFYSILFLYPFVLCSLGLSFFSCQTCNSPQIQIYLAIVKYYVRYMRENDHDRSQSVLRVDGVVWDDGPDGGGEDGEDPAHQQVDLLVPVTYMGPLCYSLVYEVKWSSRIVTCSWFCQMPLRDLKLTHLFFNFSISKIKCLTHTFLGFFSHFLKEKGLQFFCRWGSREVFLPVRVGKEYIDHENIV